MMDTRDAIAASKSLMQELHGDTSRWDENMAAAEAMLQRALALSPQDTELLTCLGAVLCDQGKYQEAVALLDLAVKLGSGNSHTHYNLGVALLGHAQPATARAAFKKAQRYPASALTWQAYFDPQAQ